MKNTGKAILSFIVAAAMILVFASCSLTETWQKLVVGGMEDGTENFDMGIVEGDVYTSNFAEIKFTLPENWEFYDREELLALTGLDADGDADELQKELIKKTTVYDMYALNPMNGFNVIVMFENIKVQGLNPDTFGEEDYAEALMKGLEEQEAGLTYEKTGEENTQLGGHEFLRLEFNATSSGVSLKQEYYIRKVGDFIMSIIVTGDINSESYFSAK